jgi:hypothetical protein
VPTYPVVDTSSLTELRLPMRPGSNGYLDSSGSSSGDIIKIQIKAFTEENAKSTFSIYVDPRHINYWKTFCLPTVILAVDLHRESVYWRQVTSTEAYTSSGKSGRVDFSTSADSLTTASKDAWSRLVAPPESKNIDALFKQLASLEPGLPDFISDLAMAEELMSIEVKCKEMQSLINKAESLIASYPWRVSSVALGWLKDLKDRVSWAKSRCGQLFNAW